jgi:ABC-type transport system substrate-binding protein
MREHTCNTGFMIAILVFLLVLPVGWTHQPKPSGTLRVAWEADISGLDPHLSFGMQARHVVGNLFNSLVTIDAELNFVPDLAESWEILENSKVYVFHLRKGVTFHDGTDFDAAAVRWNYQRVVNPEEKTLDAAYYNIVEAVEVLDAHTVKFTFKHPTRTVLPVMAADRVGFLQMSPASYEQWGREEVRLHPVGTGPFKLAKWEPNQVIVLEKNPHYFKPGQPYLDRIELRIMKEGVTRVTALRAGEVDFANMVPREHVERLTRDPQLYVLRGKDTQRISTAFDQKNPIFKDVRVRQAVLGYGIDRPAITKTALLDQAQPLWSFVPPGSRGQIDCGPMSNWAIRQEDLEALKQSHPHLMYRDFQSQSASAVTMRTDMPPFNDARVRRAISHAIDRQALIEAVWGRGVPSPLISPGLVEWTLPIEQLGAGATYYRYDPKEARRLLAEAGYPKGFKTTLTVNAGAGRDVLDDAQLIQRFLKEVDIEVELKVQEYGAYVATTVQGKYEGMVRSAIGIAWEPDRRLYRAYAADSTLNTGHVNDPTLSAMVKEQRRTKDLEARKQLIHTIQRYAAEQQYYAYLNSNTITGTWQPYVKNYAPNQSFDYGNRAAALWLDR